MSLRDANKIAMKISKETAIELASASVVKIYPDAKLIRAKEKDNLEEFSGRCGWCVVFQVIDDIFGSYDRPVEIDGETGETKFVKLLL